MGSVTYGRDCPDRTPTLASAPHQQLRRLTIFIDNGKLVIQTMLQNSGSLSWNCLFFPRLLLPLLECSLFLRAPIQRLRRYIPPAQVPLLETTLSQSKLRNSIPTPCCEDLSLDI